jgi:hypothetical protein
VCNNNILITRNKRRRKAINLKPLEREEEEKKLEQIERETEQAERDEEEGKEEFVRENP